MSLADIIILAIVAAIFIFCVYRIVKGQQEGECSDCSAGGSCGAHKGSGKCQQSDALLAQAAAAAKAYEDKK